MNETDHVKDQLCQRIEELEKEKLELNEQLDIAQQERNSYQHQFARTTEVLGEIHETLNGSGPAIVGMEAVQVRRLKVERDALAAHVERLQGATRAAINSDWSVPAEEALEEVLDDKAAASLARLKAQWQAEAVSTFALHHLGGHEQEVAEIYASRLRRQAEGEEE